MSDLAAALEPPKNFDLGAMGAGWSQRLKTADNVADTKGRGRPAKSAASGATPSTPSLTFSGKELAPLIKALGNPLCRVGEVPKLEDEEVTELSEALAPVLSKYFGESINRWGAEVALLGVTLKVAAPRVVVAMEKRQARKASNVDHNPADEHARQDNDGAIPSTQSKSF